MMVSIFSVKNFVLYSVSALETLNTFLFEFQDRELFPNIHNKMKKTQKPNNLDKTFASWLFNLCLDSKKVSILIETVLPTLMMLYLPFKIGCLITYM